MKFAILRRASIALDLLDIRKRIHRPSGKTSNTNWIVRYQAGGSKENTFPTKTNHFVIYENRLNLTGAMLTWKATKLKYFLTGWDYSLESYSTKCWWSLPRLQKSYKAADKISFTNQVTINFVWWLHKLKLHRRDVYVILLF